MSAAAEIGSVAKAPISLGRGVDVNYRADAPSVITIRAAQCGFMNARHR